MEWPGWLETWDREAFLWVYKRLHEFDSPAVESFLRWANELGNGFVLLAIVGLWVALRPTVRSAVRGLAEAGLAVALTAVATRFLKDLFDHPRPQKVFSARFRDGDLVAALGETVRNHSFPSGHTATVFALAVVVSAWAAAIPSTVRRRFVQGLSFLLAAATGVARIYAGAHFPSDVVAGALEGVLTATVALTLVRFVAGRRAVGRPPLSPAPPPAGPPTA